MFFNIWICINETVLIILYPRSSLFNPRCRCYKYSTPILWCVLTMSLLEQTSIMNGQASYKLNMLKNYRVNLFDWLKNNKDCKTTLMFCSSQAETSKRSKRVQLRKFVKLLIIICTFFKHLTVIFDPQFNDIQGYFSSPYIHFNAQFPSCFINIIFMDWLLWERKHKICDFVHETRNLYLNEREAKTSHFRSSAFQEPVLKEWNHHPLMQRDNGHNRSASRVERVGTRSW